MTLNELTRLAGLKTEISPDADILSVTEDSRRVKPGSVFFALSGNHADGHTFAESAVCAGAIAVVGDRTDINDVGGKPYWHVSQPRELLGRVAHALVGNPSESMTVIGVTGTNGKSSTITLVHHILDASGRPTAKFGTLGYEIAGHMIPASCTTPFGEELAAMFAHARDAGCGHVVMEVSSHALDQERIAGIRFSVGVFTNLTQDHLDYHGDMDAYGRAKVKLFERITGPDAFTVVNLEDPSADLFVSASLVPCYTIGEDGDIRAEEVRLAIEQTRFRAVTPWGSYEVMLHLLGRHNVLNALSSIAVCGGLGVPLERIAELIGTLPCVPGRFEHVSEGQSFQVIVDYAHTEDGLRNVLHAARAICTGRILTVFGCGGDRDKTKRSKMGATVAELGDFAIVTSDNPRTEEPHAIIEDILPGLRGSGKREGENYLVIEDRAEAIRTAIGMARPGDLVMIAGKGHENYQIIGTRKIHFDDRETARKMLEEIV